MQDLKRHRGEGRRAALARGKKHRDLAGLQPFEVVVGRDDVLLPHVVGGGEDGGKLREGTACVPFHLEERELPVAFLYVVNLLLLTGAPEIAVGMVACVFVGLDALDLN